MKLLEIEKQISENVNRLKAELESKKTSGTISDYELNTTIKYYSSMLGDGLVIETLGDTHWQIDDWNVFGRIDHPIFTIKQSWLFHDLYEHVGISLMGILMIDSAVWETKVTEQYTVVFK